MKQITRYLIQQRSSDYSLKRKKKFKISTTDSVQLQTTAVEPILENSVVDYDNRIWD